VHWSQEAENAVKKVPFFVRKKVRSRVEKEAAEAGRKRVSLADVKRTQARFLAQMSQEVKGFQVDTCFGGGGCPNRVQDSGSLLERIEGLFEKADLLVFLKEHVNGDLKFHHDFKVTLAECPNACSQPQIKDIGIIGAATPLMSDAACSACNACVDACPDNCIVLPDSAEKPRIDLRTCVHCGKCAGVCPTGTIVARQKGFRILLGGKLGRHPQLARELPGIFSQEEVLDVVAYCITFYKQHSRNGKRFAHIFHASDFDALVKKIGEKRNS
jgi:dissimilatory sulfite reductase (desulfoviridin) alpha/beta subunit